ncbi:MAG: bifunctional precorrin-2 dehydrogenase/sirohydrochlorin ferrochelatase [bacterium]
MIFYPINLNIKNRKCVIVGGGKVAERKAKNILSFDGKVKIISPELTTGLRKLYRTKKIRYVKLEYSPDMLKGAFLVYAATSQRKVNAQIARDAKRLGILVNVADSAKDSSFILPAIMRKKKSVISVSTNGKSPSLAKRIRDEIKVIL